jgi:phage FluMu protein Com
MSDLLPCPFCGTVPELRTTYGSEVVGYAGHYEIRCPRCFVTHSGRDKQNPAGGYALEVGKADAIAAWNRRAPITVQQAAKVLLDHLNTLRAFEEGTDR